MFCKQKARYELLTPCFVVPVLYPDVGTVGDNTVNREGRGVEVFQRP